MLVGNDNGGSVVTVAEGGAFDMYGGSITENTATGNGGGVYLNGGTFNMHDGAISGNTAENGGGVYVMYPE